MTACESVNANTNVQLMTDKMKRKVAHLQQYVRSSLWFCGCMLHHPIP